MSAYLFTYDFPDLKLKTNLELESLLNEHYKTLEKILNHPDKKNNMFWNAWLGGTEQTINNIKIVLFRRNNPTYISFSLKDRQTKPTQEELDGT